MGIAQLEVKNSKIYTLKFESHCHLKNLLCRNVSLFQRFFVWAPLLPTNYALKQNMIMFIFGGAPITVTNEPEYATGEFSYDIAKVRVSETSKSMKTSFCNHNSYFYAKIKLTGYKNEDKPLATLRDEEGSVRDIAHY